MARIRFSTNLDRQVTMTARDYAGSTVHAVFNEFFAEWPHLRVLIVDDRGAVRSHVRVFVDGQPIADPERLSDSVAACGVVFVTSAL